MARRAASRNETRNRIVEATAKLHGERGVLGTTWQDIAREADVSVSTVYAHFPSLSELLPACGQLVMSRVRPPAADDADEIIGDAHDTRERLLRVARALFSFYERGGPHIEVDIRERQLPGMREWEESQRATVAALVGAALAHEAPKAPSLRLISAFSTSRPTGLCEPAGSAQSVPPKRWPKWHWACWRTAQPNDQEASHESDVHAGERGNSRCAT